MTQHDLVVRGGRIMDGSGAEVFTGDVAIRAGRIVEVGTVTGRGTREIEAAGAIVTPGFVDIHTHYDGLATWENRMNPSSHHGVTTVVMGNCGVGFAPVRADDRDLLVQLMEGVEDIPGTALHEGLPWAWESFPDYLDFLSSRQFDMDVAAQLPHAALRVYVMGLRGANREEATEDDIRQMRRLTAEAITAGALGFTSSRTLNHRSINGDPTPSLTAAEAELVGIGQGLRDAGAGVLEMISDFKGIDHEFRILMSMVDAAGAPMSISLAQGGSSPHGWRKILARIEQANSTGRTVRGQVAPRAIGLLLGLTVSRNPFSDNRVYREIDGIPFEEKLDRLRDPGFRLKVIESCTDPGFLKGFDRVWLVDEAFDYEPLPETSIGAQAAALGVSPAAFAYDAMLGRDGKQLFYSPFANYAENCLDCCREMILHENTVMGLGDGGAHVGIICDASFVTYLLTHWGRDRTRGEQIDLPLLVKAQSRDTAHAVGLNDRGLLKPGRKGDLNVIDFENLRLEEPQIVNDLPSGAARLEQKAAGFLATVVDGVVTYQNGEATGELPGRLVRGAKS